MLSVVCEMKTSQAVGKLFDRVMREDQSIE